MGDAYAAESNAARAAEALAVESEAAVADITRAESELLEELHAADARNWMLAEVANEVAMRADLREMHALQGELEMQQELRASEHRCAVLQQLLIERSPMPLHAADWICTLQVLAVVP